MPADLFRRDQIAPAMLDAVRKLHPRRMLRNPVMFVTWAGAASTTLLAIDSVRTHIATGFTAAIAFWLWATVFFSNLAESLAEGRGRAQADALKASRRDVLARKLADAANRLDFEKVNATTLRRDDLVLVGVGETIPADGEIVDGIASVDESAVTGESAPVIRESGGDRSAVTGGTRVLSDWIVVRITVDTGTSFLDRMIAMIEGARRQKTPNEIALDLLLAALTLIFLLVVVTLLPFSRYAVLAAGTGTPVSLVVLVALLICLIPTTIGGLLSAIGIAGMDRLLRRNVLATSGRAVEAAGDVDILLLDKTGTITHGNRQATAFLPAPGVTPPELAQAAQLASAGDETPEGRSIVLLAASTYGAPASPALPAGSTLVPFTAETRMSGADIGDRMLRKGAADSVERHILALGGAMPSAVSVAVRSIAEAGGTPLVVAEGNRVLGTIRLVDVVKLGIRERFAELRTMGIRTVMITGDNPLTAAAIAAEAGVDDFLAQATPEMKLETIRTWQREGHLVAMTGDGTNDAPALAQADVAVAMQSGTQAAREAGNMVDLDSNPTKLLDIVETGKQMLITRGALTTFSLANDIAKYFAIIPAAFATTYPALGVLNVMQLATPQSAVLSAVIFNAVVIVALVPLALRGVRHRAASAAALLRRNLLVYGLGGVLVPFVGIKAIDLLLTALHLNGAPR